MMTKVRRRHSQQASASAKESLLLLLFILVHVTVGLCNDHVSRWHVGLTQCYAVKEQKEQSKDDEDKFVCSGCGERYKSRNSLFRHLRGSDEASLWCPLAESKEYELLQTVVIRFGYHVDEDINSANDYVAQQIKQAFCELAKNNGGRSTDKALALPRDDDQRGRDVFMTALAKSSVSVIVSGLSYSTATKLRQPSLAQDRNVRSAVSEFLSLNYKMVGSQPSIENWKEYAKVNLINDLQSYVDSRVTSNCRITIHEVDALVPRDASISAEQSCTQIAYKYLMPLTWVLPLQSGQERLDAEGELERWWKQVSLQSKESFQQQHPGKKWNVSSPKIIKKLKHSLKTVESETVANRKTRRQSLGEGRIVSDDRDAPKRLAHGRFGQLWRKERRCWSNFACPSLGGKYSSPSHESVWRTVDRARIVGFRDTTATIPDAIIEFSGDGFVVGQIERIVSSVVALTQGWLPQDFMAIATQPNIFLPAPAPPPRTASRLYYKSARYHFHELTGGRNAFEDTIRVESDAERQWESELQQILSSVAPCTLEDSRWLQKLRDDVCPAIQEQLDESTTDLSQSLPPTNTPEVYSRTLSLLRGLVGASRWPTTSQARARVIKQNEDGSMSSKKGASEISAGSFTVVNEYLWSGPLPLANDLFPELTDAVFQLEEALIDTKSVQAAEGVERGSSWKRSPSTHCAVNRNAQFTPHVDSGRGLGQSLSLIVGLGDYGGGETYVQGRAYDIRYSPLEFDGWSQLHWTAPFVNERFSLVFFSPELV